MKNKMNYVMMALVFGMLLLFTPGVFAEVPMTPEEQAITEATAMLVDEENNTITYINPNETDDENVNVYEKFNDVPENAWYKTYLSHLVQLGVIHGVGEDEFAPNDYVSRAQFATMLAFASDADLTAYEGITSFNDVSVSAWYAPQVEWAYRQGLIKGRADGFFYPESDITREEAVAIIDRYAVSENSSILDDYQYELDDNADKYLTDKEIGFLETALAPPVYNDEVDISSWASEDIDAMSKAGIICGDEDGNFNPQDPISRSECTKVISAYIVNDTKPTFYFPGGSHIEYLHAIDNTITAFSAVESNDSNMERIDSFQKYADPIDLDALLGNNDLGNITISWAKNTHQDLASYAIQKIRIDRPYITDKMQSESFEYSYEGSRHTINGAQAIWVYAYYTDTIENQNGDFISHFYEPGVGSYNGSDSMNACIYFNNHFYNAYTSYLNGNKATSYREMGMCIHYLEDMSNPYHASSHTNKNTNGKHGEYEHWADNRMVSEGYATYGSVLGEDIYSSYRYMYDADFIDIANNTAGIAKGQYSVCSHFDTNPTAALSATKNLITHTERGVAGILNRYYYYGWLNH